MRRTLTLLVLLAAVAATGGLFTLKNEVRRLEEAVAHERAAIREERAAIEVLKAEWSYLNRPGRISTLARDTLGLSEITASRTLSLAQLDSWAVGDGEPQDGASGEPRRASLTAVASPATGVVPISVSANDPRSTPQ